MKLKMFTSIVLMSFLSLTAFAQEQIMVCEGNGTGGHVKLEYRKVEPGKHQALTMTYGDRDVLDNPTPVLIHAGLSLFKGLNRISFIVSDYTEDFYVTVPAFGDYMKTTEGKCRVKNDRNYKTITGHGLYQWSIDNNEGPSRSTAEALAQTDADTQCGQPTIRVSEFRYTERSRGWSGSIEATALFRCEER